LLHANRLELPFGFDPTVARRDDRPASPRRAD